MYDLNILEDESKSRNDIYSKSLDDFIIKKDCDQDN